MGRNISLYHQLKPWYKGVCSEGRLLARAKLAAQGHYLGPQVVAIQGCGADLEQAILELTWLTPGRTGSPPGLRVTPEAKYVNVPCRQ